MSTDLRMDVIVIGAMKAATSTVCAYLEDHPDTYMVPRCEPNFFNDDSNFAKGVPWYATLIEGQAEAVLRGEGSNDYAARTLYPETAARMAAYNPDMKIIYMVRHPIDRIISAWIQNRADSGDMVPPTLDRAIEQMPDRFVGQSLYWYNLAPYREHFGDDQIFIGFMEDLRQDPQAFFTRMCAFLDITPAQDIQRGHLNESQGKRVPTQTYTWLNQSPLRGLIRAAVPQSARKLIKKHVLTQKLDTKPDFSPQVRADLAATLQPDAEAFLDHCNKPSTFWTLS